jgi:hypothetical protein
MNASGQPTDQCSTALGCSTWQSDHRPCRGWFSTSENFASA